MSFPETHARGCTHGFALPHPCQKPQHTAEGQGRESHVLLFQSHHSHGVDTWSVELFPTRRLKDIQRRMSDPFLKQLDVEHAKIHTQVSRVPFRLLANHYTILPQMLSFLGPMAEWRPQGVLILSVRSRSPVRNTWLSLDCQAPSRHWEMH